MRASAFPTLREPRPLRVNAANGSGAGAGSSSAAQVAHARRRGDGERIAVVLAAAAVALQPLVRPGGPANLAPVDAFMGLALGGALLWMSASRQRLRFPYAAGVALMAAGGALGALAGPVPGSSLLALVQDSWLVLWCWALVALASSPERLRILLAAWTYGAAIWGVLLFAGLVLGLAWLSGTTSWDGSRTSLTLGDPSYAASYFFVSIMLIWATQRPQHVVVRRVVYAILVAAIFSTGSNSGVVSLVVGSTVATMFGVYRRSGPMATVAVAAAFVFVGAFAVSKISMSRIQAKAHSSQYAFIRDGLGRSGVSVSQREMLLHESLALRREGGAVGAGPVSTKERLHAERAQFVKEAHDDYLAAVVERGPLGVLGLCVLLGGLGTRVFVMARDGLRDDFARVMTRPHALVGVFAGTAFAMAVYELLHLRHLWAVFGLIAGVHIWGRRCKG